MPDVIENWNSGSKENYVHYPINLETGGKSYLLNEIIPDSPRWKKLEEIIRNEKQVILTFYSSQYPFIFERIHAVANVFIPGVSSKIDPLLRELVKNAEKENVSEIARRSGLIPENQEHAPLEMMGRILKEKYHFIDSSIPLLYQYPEIFIRLELAVIDNLLHFTVTNTGVISDITHNYVQKRIELGAELAAFDLRQEYEMQAFDKLEKTIYGFFMREMNDEEFQKNWMTGIEEPFSSFWESSPYFLMMATGKHTSFYPYFMMAYSQLRIAQKEAENPDIKNFSAGLGFIQSSFMLEANRNIYGTYGKIFSPFNQNGRAAARFEIGMPGIEINI